ncbi:hypothetical protein ACSFA2_25635, partial [Variovorax sp. LT2P21]
DPRWREVFVFLAGLLPDGTALMEQLRGSVGRVGADDPAVRRFVAHVMAEYEKREPLWRLETRPRGDQEQIAYVGKSPVMRMLDMLRRRLDAVSWLVDRSGLRLKTQIAEELLIAAESDLQHLNADAVNSVQLMTYLQAAVLAIDCASVAVVENRMRTVAWIFAPLRS